MKRLYILLVLSTLLGACSNSDPVTPVNNHFSGNQFRVHLISKKFYQRPEKYGLLSIKDMSGSFYAVEKTSFIDKSHIIKTRVFQTDVDFYGINIELNEDGIKQLDRLLQSNDKRKVAIIVDNLIVSSFVIDSNKTDNVFKDNRFWVDALFSVNEVKAIVTGLNKK